MGRLTWKRLGRQLSADRLWRKSRDWWALSGLRWRKLWVVCSNIALIMLSLKEDEAEEAGEFCVIENMIETKLNLPAHQSSLHLFFEWIFLEQTIRPLIFASRYSSFLWYKDCYFVLWLNYSSGVVLSWGPSCQSGQGGWAYKIRFPNFNSAQGIERYCSFWILEEVSCSVTRHVWPRGIYKNDLRAIWMFQNSIARAGSLVAPILK